MKRAGHVGAPPFVILFYSSTPIMTEVALMTA